MPRTRQTHCKQGHEFTPENTQWYDHPSGKPQRKCKLCRNAAIRKRYKDDPVFREKLKWKVYKRRGWSRPPADLYLAAWGLLPEK